MLGENDIRPGLDLLKVLAHHIRQHAHPTVLFGGAVGVEVDGFTVGKANAEAFLDEHIAFFFFGEGGFPARASFAEDVFLGEGTLVVDEAASFGEVDGGSGLTGSFMVSGQF